MNYPRYQHCPRKPEGYKWWAYASGSFPNGGGASCGWGFDTFKQALDYLRQQYGSKPRDFYAYIDGPGGRIDPRETYPLIAPALTGRYA